MAGKLFGIPVRGTHAHSWIMSFPNEKAAFKAYAQAMPNNAVFLVDTFDTIEGIKNAIEAGRELEAQGYKMSGIRLDSGDLAYLSIKARKLLDDAGFPDCSIVASNDLDENIISSLKQQEAQVNVWGVGTKLVTAYDQPALGGVYKIAAIRNEQNEWDYKLKLSEQAIKISNPGILQVRRYYDEAGLCMADMIFNEEQAPGEHSTIIDPLDGTRRKNVDNQFVHEDLLKPIFVQGKRVYRTPGMAAIQQKAKIQLATLHGSIKRFTNPHQYPVGLEKNLYELKTSLILKLRHLE
jgi:nicotinate phosphoribosyltransferase